MKNAFFALTACLVLFACKKDDPEPNITPVPTPEENPIPDDYAALAGIFGGAGVGAAVNLTEDVLILCDKTGAQFAWFEDAEVKFTGNINDSQSVFAGLALDGIGAMSGWEEDAIVIYDEDGENYTFASFNPDQASNAWNDTGLFSYGGTFSINVWGASDSWPYEGVSAALPFTSPGTDCFDASLVYGNIWMFSPDGEEVLSYTNADDLGPQTDLEDWTLENNCGAADGLVPFNGVGAACRSVKANTIQNLLFNVAGDQFLFYNVSEGVVNGPYNLY